MLIKISLKTQLVLIFILFFAFFTFTINKQKLEFYSLQNAIVESLVEKKSWGITGQGTSNWTFYNEQTKTPQLYFIGDAFEYNGLWYPQKSYGAHYWASLFYLFLYNYGLSFSTHYYLVSSILLATSSILLASIGITLCFYMSQKITKSSTKALFVSIALALGSLLTGGINIRNEENFGYWLLLIVFLLTFSKIQRKWFLFILLFFLYYSIFSLPIVTLLAPYILYRIYTRYGKNSIKFFYSTNIFFIFIIFFHNYLIFHRLVYSIYQIGMGIQPGYQIAFLSFNIDNFLEKINFYLLNPQTSIFINYPLIIFGFLGVLMAKITKLEKLFLILSLLVVIFYIANIKDDGWVGYGSGRYALGLFPITYFYLSYLFKKFNPILWMSLLIASIISIYHGLFFLLSPIRNVYNRGVDSFADLPFQEDLFLLISFLLTIILLVSIHKTTLNSIYLRFKK